MIASHDSIELGEDGPTHQPVEVLPLLRSTPDLITLRPSDGNEVSGAYNVWLEATNRPTVMLLSRSDVPNLEGTSAANVRRGAYVLHDFANNGGKKVILASSGSEVHLIVGARTKLKDLLNNRIDIRVVSFPSWKLYSEQESEYQLSVLPTTVNRSRAFGGRIDGAIYVEAASKFGWDRYFDVDESIGMETFGASAARKKVWEKFGFTVDNICKRTEEVRNRFLCIGSCTD